MKRLLTILLLLYATTVSAERWVQVSPYSEIDIDYSVSATDPNIRIYKSRATDVKIRSVMAMDCKLHLFSIQQSFYFSNNRWYEVPRETLGTWYRNIEDTSRDHPFNLICR